MTRGLEVPRALTVPHRAAQFYLFIPALPQSHTSGSLSLELCCDFCGSCVPWSYGAWKVGKYFGSLHGPLQIHQLGFIVALKNQYGHVPLFWVPVTNNPCERGSGSLPALACCSWWCCCSTAEAQTGFPYFYSTVFLWGKLEGLCCQHVKPWCAKYCESVRYSFVLQLC